MMALSSWTTGRSIPGVMPHPPGCPMADVHFGLLKKWICVLECLSYVEVLSPAFWVWPYLEIGLADVIKSGWGHDGLERAQMQWPVSLWEERDLTTQTEGWSHVMMEAEWSDAATSHGHRGLTVATRSQKFQEGPSPSTCREEPGSGNTWTPSSSVLREYTCVILGHPVCGNLLSAVPEN